MLNNNLHSEYNFYRNPLVAGFLKSVHQFPNKNALFINSQFYSYKTLWKIVISIYDLIPKERKFDTIGIYCNDDVFTYAGIIAINLYGAAYVPLNKKNPVRRNKTLINQCKIELILSSVALEDFDETEILNTQNTDINNLPEQMQVAAGKDLIIVNQPVSYILFTSGSTGEPKGVPVSYSNLNSFFEYFKFNYDFNSNDRFLQVYELTFDVSVFSFFMPLAVGGCCYILPENNIKFITILKMLNDHKITVISMVPTVLRYIEKYLDEIKLPELRYSFFSGDALNHQLAMKWKNVLPNGVIHNFYGPTETTIVCTRYVWNEIDSENESVNGVVPLGKPFKGMESLIVNENNEPYEKGELCFSGDQVIENYLNNFYEDTFFIYKGKRYYKTGDIVSLNTKGNIVFYGRSDKQVKINGYRVELSEIELEIKKHTNFFTVVLCAKDKNQLNTLFAFIETPEINENELKQQLAKSLPYYMIPQHFVAIEKFPLNINQKVDTNKLLSLRK